MRGGKEQDYYLGTPEATFPGVRKICPRYGNRAKVLRCSSCRWEGVPLAAWNCLAPQDVHLGVMCNLLLIRIFTTWSGQKLTFRELTAKQMILPNSNACILPLRDTNDFWPGDKSGSNLIFLI